MGLQVTISKTCVADARLYGSNWENTGPQSTNTVTAGMYGSTQHYAFLRFGEIDIPPYANIVSATLRFYVSTGNSNSGYTHVISGVKDNGTLWTESARNGAGRDTTATANAYISNRDGKWYSFSIKGIAEAWRDRPNGMMDPLRGICVTCSADGSYKVIDGRLRANYPTLTIVYEIPASVPVPNKSSVALGGALQTTIQVNEEGARHVIAYKIGSAVLATFDLGTGTQHTCTVPTSAGAQFPNSLTGMLSVEVTTTVNGENRGAIAAEVELTLPADAAPTGSCTPGRGGQALVAAYIQGKSTAIFSVSGAAKYGATIAGYSLTFEGATYTGFPATTPMIQGSGSVPYVLTITDSRGLKTQVTGSISVLALSKPNVVLFAASRCLSNGTLDDDGDYIRAALSASVSSLSVSGSQKNKLTYRIYSRPIGATTWEEAGGAPTPSGISVADNYVLKSGSNPKEFNAYQGYEFRADVSDLFATTQQFYTIPTNLRQFVLGRDGKSVAFGGAITGTAAAPNAAFHHPACLYGGIKVLGGGLAGIGIQAGTVGQLGNTAGGGYKSVRVNFPMPFAAGTTPVVVVGFSSASTAGTFGRCCVSAYDEENTGFSLRFFNGDSSNRNPDFRWIAIGAPTE